MTIYDRPAPATRAPSPAVCLAVLLAFATGLLFLPERTVVSLRQPVRAVLRPGLISLAGVREWAESVFALVGNLGSGARQAATLEAEVARLQQRVGQLEAEAIWLRSLDVGPVNQEPALASFPLVRSHLVEARVLGRQAQSVLKRETLVDAGSQDGLSANDWVLDVPAMVDRGASLGAAPGELVLAGRSVWGKIKRVEPQMSLVRRVTESGYRDLVRVAQTNGQRLTLGPRGVLEGTGEPLCRLRLVPLTDSVAVGQLVVTEGGEGVVEGRFLYGYIERVEQVPGAAEWSIWVRPAIRENLPHKVAVLTAELTGSISDNSHP